MYGRVRDIFVWGAEWGRSIGGEREDELEWRGCREGGESEKGLERFEGFGGRGEGQV